MVHAKEQPNYDEVGMASWYGDAFNGRPTSTGERFDMHALTAAHKTLPLPGLVEVTNLTNGRRIVARVNDRGPFVDGRIIDLSREAADELDMRRDGVARVRVRYLGQAPRLGGGTVLRAEAARAAEPQPVQMAAVQPAPIQTTPRPYYAPQPAYAPTPQVATAPVVPDRRVLLGAGGRVPRSGRGAANRRPAGRAGQGGRGGRRIPRSGRTLDRSGGGRERASGGHGARICRRPVDIRRLRLATRAAGRH